MCTYPTKSPWILSVPFQSFAVEQVQKAFGGRAQSCLGGYLLIFANYTLMHVNFILVITACYVMQSIHTLPDKENILVGLFSWCQFTDQSKLLFICRHVGEGLMSLSLIPLAYHNTVEWLTVKVGLMYICLIRLPGEKWINLVTLLHIFTLQ